MVRAANLVIELWIAATADAQPGTGTAEQRRSEDLRHDEQNSVGNVDDDAGGVWRLWVRVGVPTIMSRPTGHRRRSVDDYGAGEDAERAVLLATKVHVPAIGGQIVHRAALLDALAAGRHRKLTLVSAP